MNDSIKMVIDVIVICIISIVMAFIISFIIDSAINSQPIQSEQWGGDVPMKIYTVYDRDTGVYYAVTERGGICVMETYSGETKLVDEGDGQNVHPNKG